MNTHQTDPQYKLRMPPELRDKLKQAAKDNHRSMNAEIVARLQASFDDLLFYGHTLSDEVTPDEAEDLRIRVARVEAALEKLIGDED